MHRPSPFPVVCQRPPLRVGRNCRDNLPLIRTLTQAVAGPAPLCKAECPILTNAWAVQESLRKYSVVPVVTRRCAADDEICGHRIPAGTYLACSIQVHAWAWLWRAFQSTQREGVYPAVP